ncbi:hypothetical protein TM239_67700 [Bradyrhizobium sp. TM239]|nr:hypothetical protein TM239_67700 [Bradyrhizobium sp. TM239]
MGGAAVVQLPPTIQSLLVKPVQLAWAEADPVNCADSAATDKLARSKRSIRVRVLLAGDGRVRFGPL